MKLRVLYPLLFLFSGALLAQIKKEDSLLKSTARNSIYIELAGQGGFYSIAYDRLTEVKPFIKRSFSVGFSVLPVKYNNNSTNIYSLPLSFNTIYRRYLELGIGLTPMVIAQKKYSNYNHAATMNNSQYTEIDNLFFLTPKIGFRYQEQGGGLFFRASFIPMISLTGTITPQYTRVITPWAGISVGTTF